MTILAIIFVLAFFFLLIWAIHEVFGDWILFFYFVLVMSVLAAGIWGLSHLEGVLNA